MAQIFFNDIEALQRFTTDLPLHLHAIRCRHCSCSTYLVSHGIIYKKQHNGKISIGKRLFCSNRYGRKGCGRTLALYLTAYVPGIQHAISHIHIFIASLLSMSTVQHAYELATGTTDPRNAYRWLHRLWKKLLDYRCFLQAQSDTLVTPIKSRSERLRTLLPTLQRLFLEIGESPCAQFQKITQISFL